MITTEPLSLENRSYIYQRLKLSSFWMCGIFGGSYLLFFKVLLPAIPSEVSGFRIVLTVMFCMINLMFILGIGTWIYELKLNTRYVITGIILQKWVDIQRRAEHSNKVTPWISIELEDGELVNKKISEEDYNRLVVNDVIKLVYLRYAQNILSLENT